jgi:hypothetical protein
MFWLLGGLSGIAGRVSDPEDQRLGTPDERATAFHNNDQDGLSEFFEVIFYLIVQEAIGY